MSKLSFSSAVLTATLIANAAFCDNLDAVSEAANAAFASMPDVVFVEEIAGNCGANAEVHPDVAYCTTGNRILVARAARNAPQTTYFLAHAYGHAVQVQHGIADFALRQIRTRPEDEEMLRGLVERQVDCIAGFLHHRAGLQAPDLKALFETDPLDRPHWGRNPLRIGPHLNVDVADRAQWFAIGANGDISACAPGEFTGLGLVRALRE